VPAEEKRRRLNVLLDRQEPIGHDRNRGWLGRTVEVLVDTIVPPRSHDHDEPVDAATPTPAGEGTALSGRTRQNKLVHLTGSADWVGRFVDVRIDHAGPYSLRGSPAA
jgi:tRNA-2-methylthio-N6-dimethylallyladenosine synthase